MVVAFAMYVSSLSFSLRSGELTTMWCLLAATVNGQSVQVNTGADALSAIDTGTTLIGGPSDDVKAIYAAVPGSQQLDGANEGFFSFRESPPSFLASLLILTFACSLQQHSGSQPVVRWALMAY